jgi:hypothetical protein
VRLLAEIPKPLDRLGRERAGNVPADHHRIDAFALHVREYGLERRKVPVDVV